MGTSEVGERAVLEGVWTLACMDPSKVRIFRVLQCPHTCRLRAIGIDGAPTGHRLASLGVRLWLVFHVPTVIFGLKLIRLSLWEKFAELSGFQQRVVHDCPGIIWVAAGRGIILFLPSGDGGRHF